MKQASFVERYYIVHEADVIKALGFKGETIVDVTRLTNSIQFKTRETNSDA